MSGYRTPAEFMRLRGPGDFNPPEPPFSQTEVEEGVREAWLWAIDELERILKTRRVGPVERAARMRTFATRWQSTFTTKVAEGGDAGRWEPSRQQAAAFTLLREKAATTVPEERRRRAWPARRRESKTTICAIERMIPHGEVFEKRVGGNDGRILWRY